MISDDIIITKGSSTPENRRNIPFEYKTLALTDQTRVTDTAINELPLHIRDSLCDIIYQSRHTIKDYSEKDCSGQTIFLLGDRYSLHFVCDSESTEILTYVCHDELYKTNIFELSKRYNRRFSLLVLKYINYALPQYDLEYNVDFIDGIICIDGLVFILNDKTKQWSIDAFWYNYLVIDAAKDLVFPFIYD